MKLKASVSVVFTLLFILFSSAARADTIAVQNGSFETANAFDQAGVYNNGPIPGWTITGGQAGSQLGSSMYGTPLPDGSVFAYDNGATISQTLTGIVLQPNSIYNLSVWVGNPPVGSANYSISLLAGSTLLNSLAGFNGNTPVGTWSDKTLSYSTGNSVAPGNLSIALVSSGVQVDFDKVQLTVDPVATPEPSSLLMLGSGLLGVLGFAFRRQS